MIIGEVNYRHEIVVTLSFYDKHGDLHDFPVVVDTGYDGHVVLPQVVVDALGIVGEGLRTVVLGDGSSRDIPRYEAKVRFDNDDRTVDVLVTDSVPLIGMRMLRGYNMTFQVMDGGAVFSWK